MTARRFRWLLMLLTVLAATVAALADSPSSLTWHGSTEIARGRGEKGPWRQSESRYDFVDDPSVAINSRGEIAVAWVDQARKAVLLQRFSPAGKPQLAQPVDLSRRPQTFSWLPRVAFAPDAAHSVFVLWQEIIFAGGTHGGDILFARSDDGGRSFAGPVNLSQSVGGDGKGRVNREIWHNGSLDIVAGANGVVHAAWTEYDGPLWFSRSTDGGKSFSPPRRIAGGGQSHPARGPSLALGPGGAVYLAWTVGDDQAADIRVARSADGGVTFSEPQVVEPSKTYSDAPKIAVDSAGTLHLVYAETIGGPFEPSRIQYTRSADGGRTFEPARVISPPLTATKASAAFPALGLDSARNVYVVWEQYQGTGKQPRGLGLAVSRDGGGTFATPGVVPGSMDPAGGFNGSSQGLLMTKLAVSQSGAVAIVNSSLKPNAHSRVWLIRGAMPR